MLAKDALLAGLKKMLHDVLAARARGSNAARLAHAQGYVDGYMRALLEGGLATQEDLLSLVAAERAAVSGPATREVTFENAEAAA